MNRDNMTATEKLTELHSALFKAIMLILQRSGVEVDRIDHFNFETKENMKIHLGGSAKGAWLIVRCTSYGVASKTRTVKNGSGAILTEIKKVLS